MTGAQALVAQISDEELMRRVQGDDRDAFSALYDRFARRVYGVVRDVITLAYYACASASRGSAARSSSSGVAARSGQAPRWDRGSRPVGG